MRILVLQCLAGVLLGSAAAEKLNILHRFYHPLSADTPFTVRGTIDTQNLETSYEGIQIDVTPFEKAYNHIVNEPERGLYQLAVGDENGALSGWSSVKVCHLGEASVEQLIFHTTGEPHSSPYSLDYFVAPVPHNGACPQLSAAKSIPPFTAFLNRLNTGNTSRTISVHSSELPPLPRLREPPPLTPQGEPVKPVPEKSFVQKYWVYIVAVLIALLMSGGPAEEEQKS